MDYSSLLTLVVSEGQIKKCKANRKTPPHVCFTEARRKSRLIPRATTGDQGLVKPPGHRLTPWIYWGCKGNIGPELCQEKNEPISSEWVSEWGNRAFTKWDQWALQSSPPAYLHSNFRCSSAKRVLQEACRLCWGNSLMPAGARAGKRCPGHTEHGQATAGTPGLSALAHSKLHRSITCSVLPKNHTQQPQENIQSCKTHLVLTFDMPEEMWEVYWTHANMGDRVSFSKPE